MSLTTQEEVLLIFERHRATPGAPYAEGHFLDYLLAEPKARGAVHNSFRGLRRYNAFIDEVQLKFGVHFSGKDFEANYSLPTFIARLEEIRASKRSSLASFQISARHGFGWHTVAIMNLVVAFIAALLWHWRTPAGVLAAAAIAAADVLTFRRYLLWRTYRRKLMARIQEAQESDA